MRDLATALARPFQAANRLLDKYFVVNPSSGSSVHYLDGLRAIAVLLVVVLHSWGFAGYPKVELGLPLLNRSLDITFIVKATQIGVDLFFVLSGFLLSQAWFKADYTGLPRPRLGQYFRQRFFRIMPAYYACLFLMLLFMTPQFIRAEMIFSPDGFFILGAHLFFVQYLFPLSSNSYINGTLWTLTIEMLFYFLLPVIVGLFLRNRWLFSLPMALVLSFGWLYLCQNSLDPLVSFWQGVTTPGNAGRFDPQEDTIRRFLAGQLPAFFFTFACGIAAGNLVVRHRLNERTGRFFRVATGKWAGLLYVLVGSFSVVFLMNYANNNPGLLFEYYLSRIPYAFSLALIVLGLTFSPGWLQALFSLPLLRFIGIISYSIYLWHYLIIIIIRSYPVMANMQPQTRFWVLLACTVPVTSALATGFYLLIEKPFMLRGKRPTPSASKHSFRSGEPEIINPSNTEASTVNR